MKGDKENIFFVTWKVAIFFGNKMRTKMLEQTIVLKMRTVKNMDLVITFKRAALLNC